MSKRAKVHLLGTGLYAVWVIGVLGTHYYFTGAIL